MFGQLVADVNLAVSVEAVQAIGNLARGLRSHFSGSSRFLLPILLVSMLIESRHWLEHLAFRILSEYVIFSEFVLIELYYHAWVNVH